MAAVRQPEFGRRLRQLRLNRGVKQTELAGGTVSASYISRLEAGNRLPSAQALQYLATGLGTTVKALVGDDSETEEEGRLGSGLLVQASLALRDGEFERVVELLEPHAATAGRDASEWDWHLLWTLAEAYGRLQALPERIRTLRQLLSLDEFRNEDAARARILTELSRDERALGHIGAALEAGSQALVAARQAPATVWARVLIAVTAAETEAGAAARAAERIPGMLALAEKVPVQLATQIYWACAGVRVRQGRSEDGDRLMQQALDSLDSHDDPLAWARLRMAAGALRLRCGRVEGVRELIEEAATALRLVGGPAQQADMQALMARLLGAEGRYEEACQTACEAEESGLLSFQDRLRTRLLRSQCMLHLGQVPQARQLMRDTAVEAEGAGCLDLAAEAWKSLATALDESGSAAL
jgi:transcriptional regulator with XRE-family HTH domain